jgi:hypothetical protein
MRWDVKNAWCALYWRREVPRQGMGWEDLERQISLLAPPGIHKNYTINWWFPIHVDVKIS